MDFEVRLQPPGSRVTPEPTSPARPTCRKLATPFDYSVTAGRVPPKPKETAMPTITPFLWFDTEAEEAMQFYAAIFKRSRVIATNRAQGKVVSVRFELENQEFIALNAGPEYKFSEAVSFFVGCETQQEIDELWAKLTADGGSPGRCGWLKDKFGLSWQIVPTALGRMLGDPSSGKHVMQAMLQMSKLDVKRLEEAASAA
jgi:predicted 3-demethylubiquinone-9 3-methyltransferase (glyoxalase superfamily)